MKLLPCVLVAAASLSLAAQNHDVILYLDGAILTGSGSPRVLDVDAQVRDGEWHPRVYGYAQFFDAFGERTSAFNAADHEGVITSVTETETLLDLGLAMTINPDPWVSGGSGSYALTLVREGENYSGTFSGTYNGQSVGGSVTGYREAPFAVPVPGYVPLEAGEHPRLVFRRAELPQIQQRATQTAEGQAIMQQLDEVLVVPTDYCSRYPSWMAAGWAFKLLMTGDPGVAATTKTVVQTVMTSDPCNTKMIRRAPRYMGIALAYDFAYNYWEENDPAFRQEVCAWLEERALEIIAGGGEGYNQHPASNWMGIAYGSLGTIAMAILGDELTYDPGTPDEETVPVRTALRSLELAEQGTRRWLLDGLGDHGWFGEGQGYLRFALTAGMAQYLHAYRTALGLDVARNGGADMILPLVTLYSLGAQNPEFGPGGWANLLFQQEERSGCFNMLMGLAPEACLPALRWKYDQLFGLEGNGTFNIFMPYQAAYALQNYPFDAVPRSPEGLLPQALHDVDKGFFILRSGWTESADLASGSGDIVSVLYLKSKRHRSTWQASPSHDFRIHAFDTAWAALPHVDAVEANDLLGGNCIRYALAADGSAIMTMDAGDAYRVDFADVGVDAFRSFGADYSAQSGAPALFAIADRISGATNPVWRMSLDGTVTVEGSSFTAVQGSRRLSGTVYLPEAATVALSGGTVQVAGGDRFFVVMTLQDGPAPEPVVSGTGTGTVVVIGNQRVFLEGDQVAFDHFEKLPAWTGMEPFTVNVGPEHVDFALTAGPGRQYWLEQSDELNEWRYLPGSRLEGAGGTVDWSAPLSGDGGGGFFRVMGKDLQVEAEAPQP